MSSALRVFLLLYFRGVAATLERRPAPGPAGRFLSTALEELSAFERACGVN